MEISRSEDILGNVTVRNQYNFGLHFVPPKAPGDDVGATINADWLMDFQRWVQEQSVRGIAPSGNHEPHRESLKAQTVCVYDADGGGAAVYMVTLSAEFTMKYEVI